MNWTPVAEVVATGGPHDKEDRVLVELQAELPPIGTKLYAAKPEFSVLQAQYQRLANGVESDLAEIDRIQGVYDEQFRKGRKLRMERDALLNENERLSREWADEAADHRITQVNRDTWRSNYHVAQAQIARIKILARAVIEEQMSHVNVHPCDEHSEDIKARGMPQVYRDLYEALK